MFRSDKRLFVYQIKKKKKKWLKQHDTSKSGRKKNRAHLWLLKYIQGMLQQIVDLVFTQQLDIRIRKHITFFWFVSIYAACLMDFDFYRPLKIAAQQNRFNVKEDSLSDILIILFINLYYNFYASSNRTKNEEKKKKRDKHISYDFYPSETLLTSSIRIHILLIW